MSILASTLLSTHKKNRNMISVCSTCSATTVAARPIHLVHHDGHEHGTGVYERSFKMCTPGTLAAVPTVVSLMWVTVNIANA